MPAALESAEEKTSWLRDPRLWFVLASGAVYGAVFNLLPVTFPVFQRQFGTSLEQMGRTQLAFFISSLLVSVGGGWAIGRLGLRNTAGISLVALAAGLSLIAAARSFGAVLAGAFLFGMAVSAFVVVCGSLISDSFAERRQSVFSMFGIADAIGSIAGPAALGWWLGRNSGASWRLGYIAAAAVVLILAVWTRRLPAPASAVRRETVALAEMKGILGGATIYGIGLAMFLHGLAQMGMVSWVGQYFQKTHSIGTAEAAYFISVNSAGFFAGRSLLTWLSGRWKIPELLVLAISAGGGTLAFAATLAAPTYLTGLAAFTLAGMFISGDAPSMNSYIGLRFAGRTAMAFALLSGIGNIGGAAGPYVTGLIGDTFGLESGIRLMPLFSLLLAALALGWYVRTAREDALPRGRASETNAPTEARPQGSASPIE